MMRKTMTAFFPRLPLLLLLLSALISCSLSAQDKQSSFYFDSVTYQSYMRGDWKGLIRDGMAALSKGYDYYYLRMRLGAAFYETGNYRQALKHYNSALEYNSSDAYALSGKYYSFLNLGMSENARQVSGKLEKINPGTIAGPPSGFIDFISFETGISPPSGQGQALATLAGSDSIYGYQEIQQQMLYNQFGGKFVILPSLSFYLGVSSLNIRKEQQLQYSEILASRDSIANYSWGTAYFYGFPRSLKEQVISSASRQKELYLNLTYVTPGGWRIRPAVHYIDASTSLLQAASHQETLTDTAYYLAFDSSWYTFDYQGLYYTFRQSDTTIRNLVMAVDVSKDFGNFTATISGSLSDFRKRRQTQIGASLAWYPLGNTNLYGIVGLTALKDGRRKQMIFDFAAGGKVFKNFWLTASTTLGNLDLYNEKNAYVVFNQPDPIVSRMGLDGTYLIGKHLEMGIYYRITQKEYQWQQYVNGANPATDPPLAVSHTSRYSNQSIFGGLKWKF